MNVGRYFIDRPRFAAVLSILLVIVGVLSFLRLPVSQYPEIAPPTIQVRATYPGASPEVIADTVSTPLEQEINGVERMLYMNSQATSDGQLQINITFELGTDLDTAQVQVQNRIAAAEPRLPEEVRRLGVTASKSSPDLMMVLNLRSPERTYDPLYISNFAQLRVRDVLLRINGVGSITIFGLRDYSMRVWLDPERLAALDISADDVVRALQSQNVQVASGTLGQPPMPLPNAFQFMVKTEGRFADAEQFREVIIKRGREGRLTRLGDVARVELAAREYSTSNFLNGVPGVGVAVFQRPGSNALETARQVLQAMDELARGFPPDLVYEPVYNVTAFVEESVKAVYTTMIEAVLLVVLVIVLFLQSWRAAVIPIVAIPVSLIGTCAVMELFGFSLNSLSLFGLVLAIGIVVDDAIVVVENIERNLEQGMSPRDAARVTMDEVAAALVSIALVLVAVFVPAAFIGGITGQFFQQFALTVASATIISAFNSLTLSPALGGILLRPRHAPPDLLGRLMQRVLGPLFTGFNAAFDRAREWYSRTICRTVRHPPANLAVFGLLLLLTAVVLWRVPSGFIPHQDQGVLIAAAELPPGASLERTEAVVLDATQRILQVPGVANVIGVPGFSGATFASASHAAAMFILLEPFDQRDAEQASARLAGQIWGVLAQVKEAQFFVIDPPPVRGLGRGGGFKMLVEDQAGRGIDTLYEAMQELVAGAAGTPGLERVFGSFSLSTPQYFLDIDRTKAEMLQVPVENVFQALQIYLGSAYVNDFNLFGRTYRVIAQADAEHRLEPRDVARLHARNADGGMVPLGSIVQMRRTAGPDRLVRYNLYPAVEVQGSASPGVSTGEALQKMEQLAARALPPGIGFEWTELALQERLQSSVGLLIFPLSVLFAFLFLTAQYESWSLPIAIVMIVPLCILFALTGVSIGGMDNNILTQVGMIVLIGLACKNAILIVEFARQYEEKGMDPFRAATEAAHVRLRPILMTSVAFVSGVFPMVIADGAGAEMRRVLGTTVFSGMIGVTLVGLFLTPVFYTVIRGIVTRREARAAAGKATA